MSKEVRLAKSIQKETTSNNRLSTTRNLIITLKQKCTKSMSTQLKSLREIYPWQIRFYTFLQKISKDVKGKNSKDCWTRSKENQFQELDFRTKSLKSFCGTIKHICTISVNIDWGNWHLGCKSRHFCLSSASFWYFFGFFDGILILIVDISAFSKIAIKGFEK